MDLVWPIFIVDHRSASSESELQTNKMTMSVGWSLIESNLSIYLINFMRFPYDRDPIETIFNFPYFIGTKLVVYIYVGFYEMRYLMWFDLWKNLWFKTEECCLCKEFIVCTSGGRFLAISEHRWSSNFYHCLGRVSFGPDFENILITRWVSRVLRFDGNI